MTTQESTPDTTSTEARERQKTSFAGDMLKLVSGATVAQILSILASPILTRLYAPEAFGTLALFVSITNILAVAACLRYEIAIMLPAADDESANLLATSLISTVAVSLLSGILIWAVRAPLVAWLDAPRLAPFLWLVPSMVFLRGAYQALNYWNTRTKHYGRLSVARISNSVVNTSTKLVFGFAGYTTGGVMIGSTVAGTALASTILGWQVWIQDHKLFIQSIRWQRVLAGMLRYRKFPLIDIWGAFVNIVSWQLPVLLLSAFFSPIVVGFYAFAFRLIQLPMSIIGGALGQVYYQRISVTDAGLADVRDATIKVFQRLVELCMLPALILGVIGSDIFGLIFGPEWVEAGTYAQILSIWMFFWFISSPLSSIFFALERQGLALLVHMSILGTRLISLITGGLLGSIYVSLWLFSISGTIVYGALVFWNLYMVGISFAITSKILLRYFSYSVLPVGLLLILTRLNVHSIWLISVAAIEIGIYFSMVFLKDPTMSARIRVSLSETVRRII